jgi:hypothetical protein
LAFAVGKKTHLPVKRSLHLLAWEVGRPEPAFALPDQFGHQQTNETLKGSSGTVLLFFRSADW